MLSAILEVSMPSAGKHLMRPAQGDEADGRRQACLNALRGQTPDATHEDHHGLHPRRTGLNALRGQTPDATTAQEAAEAYIACCGLNALRGQTPDATAGVAESKRIALRVSQCPPRANT